MRTRLRYLPLSDVSEGMVLGAPLVLTEHGVTNFSLPAGHVLTESNLLQAQRRHGEFVCIAEPDPRSEAEVIADQQAVATRLGMIFARADMNQPAVRGLHDAVLAYRGR